MSAAILRAVLALALALGAGLCAAQVAAFRVDDSGTVVSQPLTPMRWRQLVPGRAGDNTLEGRVSVAVQLHLAPWLGRSGRIYMAMAPTQGERVQAVWRTQGRLQPGQVQSGGRTLIYEGAIRDAYLRETIAMELSADGRALANPQALQFYFEIEVNP